MEKFELVLLNAMEKVFPTKRPGDAFRLQALSGLRGEELALQAAFTWAADPQGKNTMDAEIRVVSPFGDVVRCRRVGYAPALTPCVGGHDGDVLSGEPGLFPDILTDMPTGLVKLVPGQWRCVWIDVALGTGLAAGTYPLTVQLVLDGSVLEEASVTITVIAADLPAQTLIHTAWFHTDCLADYYEVPVFSEAHWTAISQFIQTAVKRGINMILTPIFTPPLDTAIGGERTTVQLVDVTVTNGAYAFGFEKFDRWIRLCLDMGVEYFEMAHLYSQWGAKFAPKVMGMVDGEEKRLFGWETEATSEGYRTFLQAFLPALTDRLRALGVAERTFFHISDEPHGAEHEISYAQAAAQAAPYLEGFRIVDALSDFSFYQKGLVKKPIPANDSIEPFLAAGIEGLWTYYCVAQNNLVSNRFMAMPSARNRIISTQLYTFDIEGFLHWGYNFYNAQRSAGHINPFMVTDADDSFSSGDSFLVYPGRGFTPVESIRLMVFFHALQDLRAMRLLEKLAGRETVLALIQEGADAPITFSRYPKDAAYIMALREKINAAIAARV